MTLLVKPLVQSKRCLKFDSKKSLNTPFDCSGLMANKIFEKVFELDSHFDSVLQKIYDLFMPPRNKTVILLHEKK